MPSPHDDPITTASSGLLALGVGQQRRIETLGLLSALIDLADERGEVLLDQALMDTEERLGIDACLEGYEWLERLDVLYRTWSGWMIPNYAAYRGPVGLAEASMVVLRRHLSRAEEEAPTVVITTPVAVPDAAPVVQLKPWRRRVPAIAAGVAAGVAVLAGATQFVPQAAVTGRNAAVRTDATAGRGSALTSAATQATEAAGSTSSLAGSATPNASVITTTSTTVLPCVTDVLDDLTNRTKLTLRSTPTTTQLPPALIPCP